MQQFNIVKLMNESDKTNLETLVNIANLDSFKRDYSLRHYQDNNGLNRFVVCNAKSLPIAAILFDENNTCIFRETLKEYRLQGLQSNLWLFSASVLGSVKHSEDLTEDGKKLIK